VQGLHLGLRGCALQAQKALIWGGVLFYPESFLFAYQHLHSPYVVYVLDFFSFSFEFFLYFLQIQDFLLCVSFFAFFSIFFLSQKKQKKIKKPKFI
jgi:hypothetical protein